MSISIDVQMAFGVVVSAEEVVAKLRLEIPDHVREDGLLQEYLTGVGSEKNIRFFDHIVDGGSLTDEVLVGDRGSGRTLYSKGGGVEAVSFTALDNAVVSGEILEVARVLGKRPGWHYWVSVY